MERARRSAYDASDLASRNSSWKVVVKKGTEALCARKDLQIAVSVAMGWVQCHGWGALQPSIRFVREFHERFWINFSPHIETDDEGKPEFGPRLGRLEALAHSSSLPLILRMVPLTGTLDNIRYSLSDLRSFEIDARADRVADAKTRSSGEQGVIDVYKAALATSDTYFRSILDDIANSLEELDRLDDTIARLYFGGGGTGDDDVPDFRPVREVLSECQELVSHFQLKKGVTHSGDPDVVLPEPDGDNNGVSVVRAEGVKVSSHMDAVALLNSISRHLAMSDRHNPARFLIEEAIRWTEMPMSEWFLETMADPDTSKFVAKLMRSPNPK